jgi:phage-related protein
MRDGLFEVRTRLDGNRQSRVFFCVHAKHLVLLHGFIKKQRATPKKELDLAINRKSEVENEQRK